MDYDKHFLPIHKEEAKKQHSAVVDCLVLINAHTTNGDLELANDRAIDMMRSLKELTTLAEIKVQAYE